MNFKDRFKKFGGDFIPDIVEYLKNYLKNNPNTTISVGCDSIQRRKTIYAITIVLHDKLMRDGAHVVFFRDKVQKVRNNDERLNKEAIYAFELAEFLHAELEPSFIRADINILERKKYKYHLLKSEGKYAEVPPQNEEIVISNLSLDESEIYETYKLVDIHLDFNPFENTNGRKTKNKSNGAYKANAPWIRGMQYRVFCKPNAFAASTSSDFLLKD